MAENISGQRHDRTALVLYGSETGNSEDVAEDLGRMLERLRFSTQVSQMDMIDIKELLNYTIVIFSVSTTGQGEFPRNGRKFWKSLLKKRLPPDCLCHVTFTTFGLGDSSYPKFNFSARKLHKRLGQLGAREVYPRGEADDRHDEGIDGTFLPWSADLRKHLLTTYPLPEGVEPIPSEVLLPPKFMFKIMEEQTTAGSEEHMDVDDTNPPPDAPGQSLASRHEDPTFRLIYNPPPEPEQEIPCPQLKEPHPGILTPIDQVLPPRDLLPIPDAWELKLISNTRVTPESHWQDVRELTFVMSNEIDLFPGDYMVIYPKNFPEDVQKLIDLQDWNEVADKKLHFWPQNPKFYNDKLLTASFPNMNLLKNCTLRDLLTHNFDITAIPKRHFFEIAANCTEDLMHKERLHEFHNPAFTDEFYDYTTRPRRSILEILHDFPTVKLPWQWVATIFPPIRGRSYSLSNGGLQRQYQAKYHKVSILVAIVKYRTVLKSVRHGLCTRYLASLRPGTVIRAKFPVDNGFYKLSKTNPKLPLLLIAPGTGIAPCRSLLQERQALALNEKTSGMEVGRSYLFFGGRNKDADYFYKDEWSADSLKTTVFTAFSRDQKEKIYVQDILRKNGELVADLLCNQNAIVYICGSSGNMPKAVRQAFIDVILKWRPEPGMTPESVEVGLQQAEKAGHYIQETW